jgi:hypothetical protein
MATLPSDPFPTQTSCAHLNDALLSNRPQNSYLTLPGLLNINCLSEDHNNIRRQPLKMSFHVEPSAMFNSMNTTLEKQEQESCYSQQTQLSSRLLPLYSSHRPISDMNLSYSDSTALLCPLDTYCTPAFPGQLGGTALPPGGGSGGGAGEALDGGGGG